MPRYSKEQLSAITPTALSYRDCLRKLGLGLTGGNQKILKKWIKEWDVDISHFNAALIRATALKRLHARQRAPDSQVFCRDSNLGRGVARDRILRLGLKKYICEMCGQGPEWQGKSMPLILDHKNGKNNDHTLSNLRFLCPNCNATLDTFCGRKNLGKRGLPLNPARKHMTDEWRHASRPGRWKFPRDKVDWDQLSRQIEELGYCATGRLYGVSDNAIRKWMKRHLAYPNEHAQTPPNECSLTSSTKQ